MNSQDTPDPSAQKPELSQQTVDFSAPRAADTEPSASGVTMDMPAVPAASSPGAGTAGSDSPGATIQFSPSTMPQVDATIGFAPAASDRPAGGSTGKSVPFLRGYEILGELGRGGMGVVYKARQTKLSRLVAVKMVLAGGHAGPEQLARFQTEAMAVASLQHPNIVQIYEVGESDGLPYFTLEFVDGGPLDKVLGGKPQIPEFAARLMETLAHAMDYAHKHGVLHRDLKPANVLLTAGGDPKITDFGLAKKLEGDSSQTKSGALMGTPSYMAPEQARGELKELTVLADVHSLGAMLYEMLTGRPPFLGATPVETIMQVINQEPVPPSRLIPKLPRDIETICLKCLQKEPHKRYASGEALAEDLRRFRAGEPIQARPVSAPERLWRWCRRNPRMAGLSAAVLVLLVTASTALAISSGQMAREREMVNLARVEAKNRLERGKQEVARSNFGRAHDLLSTSLPLVDTSPHLVQVRDEIHLLRDQVALYREFKELLDNARYFGLFGPKSTLKESQNYCQKVIELYDQIDQKTGKASCGMPPLNAPQQQLLKEEFFEAFLVSAQVEWEMVAQNPDLKVQQAAAKKGVEWLDRAEKIDPSTWILHYRRSALLTKLGDAQRAAADAKKMTEMRPTSPLDRFWFGLALHMEADAMKDKDSEGAKQRYQRAIQEFSAVVRSRPDHFWAYFDGAACQYSLGNFADAAIGFTMCIQVRPEVPWPYFNRGTILAQQNQFEAAIEDMTYTLQHNPDFADALDSRGLAYSGLNKTDLALADFEHALKIDPNLVSVYIHRAEVYRKLNRQPEAFAEYERAIKIDPKKPLLYNARGAAYLALLDYAKAREDFATLVALQPTEAQNYRTHGVVSLRLHDLPAAHADWDMLAKLMPASEEPKYYSAVTYKAQRKYDEALQALGEAIQIKPADSKLYLSRAQINHQLGNLPEALADQALVLTKIKDVRGEVLNDYGDLLRTMGNFSEAAAAYQQSIQMLPKQTDAYVGLALVHILQGKPDDAEPVFGQLMAANPDSFRAYLRRAEFQRSRGKWDEALADCDRAAQLDPKSPLAALVRASIRAARGEFREGIADAEKVLQAASPDGQLHASAASVFSLASQTAEKSGDSELARQYADRAASLLAETMEKGFLDLNFQAFNRFLVDPALAPIRQHPKVLELLPVLRKAKT